jgi:hypothetical protein
VPQETQANKLVDDVCFTPAANLFATPFKSSAQRGFPAPRTSNYNGRPEEKRQKVKVKFSLEQAMKAYMGMVG